MKDSAVLAGIRAVTDMDTEETINYEVLVTTIIDAAEPYLRQIFAKEIEDSADLILEAHAKTGSAPTYTNILLAGYRQAARLAEKDTPRL